MTFSGLTNQVRESSQRSNRNGARIDTFLIHHQAGTNDDSVINEMVTGSKQVSANYTISNEGRLTGVVPEEYRAWTSGSSTDGGKGAAWDRRSITVEIENEAGAPNWPISPAAIDTAARLLNDLKARYGIVNVLGHRDLWNLYRASYATFCPGPSTVAGIVSRAGGLSGTPTPTPPPTPSPSPTPSEPTDFGGAAGRPAWVGLQTWLAREWGYSGLIDGIPGKLTWTALQKYLKANWAYQGLIDGIPGELSWGAAQRWLANSFGYSGRIDGIPGNLTYAAMGRAGASLKGAPAQQLPRTQIDGIPGKITWTRGQTWLKRDWGYTGPTDGVPGVMTWKAFQRFLKTHWGYTGPTDGVPGTFTYSAMQRWLKAQWGYSGRIDGVPGVLTWSAFQRFVNSI